MSPPLVSIVIVNYNGWALLRECLRSVFAQPYRPIEVIVVDNASIDDSVEMVGHEFPSARVICSEKNLGFAEGNNAGVRDATGDYVVLLNNDTTVESDWLPPLVETASYPNVGEVCSKVITDGIPEEFYQMNGSVNYLGHNIMRQFADLSMIFFAGGTSLMFRRSVVGEPFLSEYFLYQEDLYLSWLMRLRGLDVRMEQRSVVRHRGNATVKRQRSSLISYYLERNRFLNIMLFYEVRTLVKLIPYLAFDLISIPLYAALRKSKSVFGTLKAYLWLMTHLSWIAAQRTRIQAVRRVDDESVMGLMSADVVDVARSHAIGYVFNAISRMYARIVGLPFHKP